MKFWETFKEEHKKDNKYPWWLWSFFALGLVIGFGVVALVVGALFLFLGWGFSFLWNYAIAPTFSMSELTTYTGGAILFLIFATARLIKWIIE